MSNPNLTIFVNFVNAFRGLVDSDEETTLAAITPILGDQLNVNSLGVVSKFLTNFFYEDVEVGAASYVCLFGIRIPLSSFSFFNELVSTTPPGVMAVLADALASLPTGESFPDSFVADVDPRGIIDPLDVAKIRLHAKATGSSVTLDDYVSVATAKLRLSSLYNSGDEHASSDTVC